MTTPEKYIEMQDKPPALIVERGKDDSTLIIAFCGLYHGLGVPPFEFFHVSKLLGYSRIICRDLSQLWYHKGLNEDCPDIPTSVALLRGHIAELAPKKVMAIGTSSGAYAAMVFGHLLGVGVVHAFGPQTFLGPRRLLYARRLRDAMRLFRLYRCPTAAWNLFDLKTLLREHNGATQYYLHFCEQVQVDRKNAERLASLPGIHLRSYPCNRHGVTKYLVKEGLLLDLLKQKSA